MDNPEDFADETILERVIALSEMVPQPIINTACQITCLFKKAKTVTWALASTAAILILPISLEMERQEYLQQIKNQERNIILGPQVGGP